jgi:23S rRNA (pseudouridine1915-N3)-methyltransferase
MKIELWSIGKANEKYFDDAIKLYSQRINNYHNFKLVCVSLKVQPKLVQDTLKQEADLIITQLVNTDYFIVLDDKGKSFTTMQLSKQIEQILGMGFKRIVILIGGAYGIHESVKAKAHLTLSLSALTYPHQLVRLIVCEQLYRVFSLHKGEKYHHE